MKTDSVFIPLRNFKLAVIAKETSTVISVITHTIYELQWLMINLEFCLQCYACVVLFAYEKVDYLVRTTLSFTVDLPITNKITNKIY